MTRLDVSARVTKVLEFHWPHVVQRRLLEILRNKTNDKEFNSANRISNAGKRAYLTRMDLYRLDSGAIESYRVCKSHARKLINP